MSSPTSKFPLSSSNSLNPLQDDDLSDLTKKEVVFWSHKLKISPSKIFSLSKEELDNILQNALPSEFNAEKRRAQCKRWERLTEMKQKLIDNQHNDRLKGGTGGNIWHILAQAANEIEEIYRPCTCGVQRSNNSTLDPSSRRSGLYISPMSPVRPMSAFDSSVDTPLPPRRCVNNVAREMPSNPLNENRRIGYFRSGEISAHPSFDPSNDSPFSMRRPGYGYNRTPDSSYRPRAMPPGSAFDSSIDTPLPPRRCVNNRAPDRTFDVPNNRAPDRTFDVPNNSPPRRYGYYRTGEIDLDSAFDTGASSNYSYGSDEDYSFESTVDDSFGPNIASTPCQNDIDSIPGNVTFNAGAAVRSTPNYCPVTPSSGYSRLSNVSIPSGMRPSTYTATPLSVQSRLSVVSPPSGMQCDSWAPQQMALADESCETPARPPLFRNYTDYSIRYSPDGTEETANSISVENYDGTSGKVTASSRTFTLPPATTPTGALELSNISPPQMASGCARRSPRGQIANVSPPALASGCRRQSTPSPNRCAGELSNVSPPALASGCPRQGSPPRSRNDLSNFSPPSMASGCGRHRSPSPSRNPGCTFDLSNVSPPSGMAGAAYCPHSAQARGVNTPVRSRPYGPYCPRRIINEQ